MPSTQNPFDQGYAAIIAALEAWKPLTDLVRVGNILSLQTPGYVPRANVQAGDRVELRLLESSLGFRPFSVNAIAVDTSATYPLQVRSGQLGISKINLVMWEVGRALTNLGPKLGLPIVLKWDLAGDASVRPNDQTANRPDWSSIATIRLEFKIGRDEYLSNTYT